MNVSKMRWGKRDVDCRGCKGYGGLELQNKTRLPGSGKEGKT